MMILTNPITIENSSILLYLKKIFEIPNEKSFLFFFGSAFLTLFIISTIFRTFNLYAQVRFILMREYSISKKFVENYLYKPYYWFLNNHSVDLTKNILSEINIVIHGYFLPALNLISQGVLIILILVLLSLINYNLAFNIFFILSLTYLSIFLFMKKILFRLGKERLEVNTERYRILIEAFSAFKIVKIHGAEKNYLNRFLPSAKSHAINQSYSQIISILPRFIIEGVAFSLLMLIILLVINNDTKFHEFIPLIALYTFSGYRLLPALQNFYFSISQMRFSQKAFDSLYENIKKIKLPKNDFSKNQVMPFSKSIKLINVSYKYPGSRKYVFRKLNLTIPSLKTLAIVGPSGSGKTTILDIITGLLDPNEGFLMIDKKIINPKNKRYWQNNIGYVPQNIYLSDDTIETNIAFGVEKKNLDPRKVIQAAIDSNIHSFIMRLPNGYKTYIGEQGVRLSGGQRQRLGIARALYNEPKILILDEATSSLDYLSEKILINCINNLKKKTTTILVTHRRNFIKKFDTIISLKEGKILKIK